MASSEGKKEASASFFVFGFGKDSRMLQKEEGLVASEEGEEFRCVLVGIATYCQINCQDHQG